MNKIAIFPGSFDPVTRGHEDLIRRAAELFDILYVAMGTNSSKHYCFDVKERRTFLEQTFSDDPRIKVIAYEGLTVDLCTKLGARVIIRGLRSPVDYEYENKIAVFNSVLLAGLETIYLGASAGFQHFSSTIVREIYLNDGDISAFVPDRIIDLITKR